MTPLGRGESVGDLVAGSLDLVDRSGLPYRLGPMGTCVEGPWDEVFGLIARCHRTLERRAGRISTLVKIDWRSGARGRLDSKAASIERRLGRPLSR